MATRKAIWPSRLAAFKKQIIITETVDSAVENNLINYFIQLNSLSSQSETRRLSTANRSRVSLHVTNIWPCRGGGVDSVNSFLSPSLIVNDICLSLVIPRGRMLEVRDPSLLVRP